ncbi:hypothetical protein GCM10010156_73980 [Planobispora rosea]|uniref:Uncharacterized protein n=1 Tax=Planobispora rosea TaxID=35762 RepID=A0A8J3WGZ7_PLARO|nr:hypothetical protein [Planobispora rosea]GGT05484.1 hypothetical protein GCM10010156_73980 [Planobispora rosea]GIH88953.1 hypothetical protein Pro02_73610 [Planobispora rosea]
MQQTPPGTVTDAALDCARSGGSTTQALLTMARVITLCERGWEERHYDRTVATVIDTAANMYADLSFQPLDGIRLRVQGTVGTRHALPPADRGLCGVDCAPFAPKPHNLRTATHVSARVNSGREPVRFSRTGPGACGFRKNEESEDTGYGDV